jgi:heat shock protein HtpX
MYIINPFRKKGMKASDLTSTHPPISERIRILRAMSGASFSDYDQAYSTVRGSKGVIPATSLAAEAVPIATTKLEGEAGEPTEIQRARETSDVMWRLNNYNTIECDCGAKLRLPPKFKEPTIKCPHCGRIHEV